MKQARILSREDWPRNVKDHTVTFVRHGEKDGNGFMADLTEKGRRDAENAGSRISYSVDLFLASPSPRTVSTAECIRKGNGSSAAIIREEQLAEPGLGFYTDFGQAMKSFLTDILNAVADRRAEVVIAVTHNYVLEYVAHLPGCGTGIPDYLSGITVNLEDLEQIAKTLRIRPAPTDMR